MDEPIRAQHFVMCRQAEIVSDAGFFDAYQLSSVNYRYRVPSDRDMSPFDPHPASRVDLFTRFYGGQDAVDFEIEFHWLEDSPSAAPDCSEIYGPFTVYFREEDPTRDFVFRLRNVPLFGVGRYAFTLRRVSGIVEWEGDTPLAVEYFEVVQA